MNKIEFRDIESAVELEKFIERVKHHTNVRLPSDYVSQARVIGIYSSETLVGGYMLVTQPNFRSLMFVPDQQKRNNEFFARDQYDMVEVNGLWIGPGVKTPKNQFKVWTHLLIDVLKCRKKYLLLMCNRKNKTIQRIHNMLDPVELYSGAPQLLGAQVTHDEVKVSYTTRWRAIKNFPRYISELRSREHRVDALGEKKREISVA